LLGKLALSFSSLTEGSDFDSYWYDERVNARSRQVISWSALTVPYEYANVSTYSLQDGSLSDSFRTAGHGDVELSFMRSLFREIDKLIEPEFVEVTSDQADIVLISSLDDLLDGTAAGFFTVAESVNGSNSSSGEKIGYVAWRDATGKGYLDGWEMHVIVHEIGHALRLSHPGAGGQGGESGGYNHDWNQKESVMSYNSYQGSDSLFYRDLDIQALQSFWGKESDPAAAAWPATESLPSKVKFLDKPLPGLSTGGLSSDGGGLTIGQVDSSSILIDQRRLIDEITNLPWQQEVARKIGGDNVMNIYIDEKGKSPMSSSMRRVAKLGSMSGLEVQFIQEIVSRIDSASALDLSLVRSPASADVIISGAKKMPKYSAYYEWEGDAYHLAWINRSKDLTSLDQVKITSSLMAAAGLKESVDGSFSTFDTVMSWNGNQYYGLTGIDKMALSEMWGPV